MLTPLDAPALLVVPTDQVEIVAQQIKDQNTVVHPEDLEEDKEEIQYSSLFSFVNSAFQAAVDARRNSGIDDKLEQSLRAYNGEYDPEDLEKIRNTGGSQIYMNLTPTKCRAAMSWIRDILMAAKEKAWGFSPTSVPTLPDDTVKAIDDHFNQLLKDSKSSLGSDGTTPKPMDAANTVATLNQLKRDVQEAIADEVYKVAEVEVKRFETIVEDQLQEGCWDEVLSQFISDFCIFPAAIMKGPVITKKRKISYENGIAVPKDEFIFLNQRVSPFDFYPSSSASDMMDGDIFEHLRLTRASLYALIPLAQKEDTGYKEEAIRKVLQESSGETSFPFVSSTEPEKAKLENKGDSILANKDTIHGIHAFCSVPYSVLIDFGFSKEEIGTDEDQQFEVEVILAGTEVIKCCLNTDPLLRRPYYKACWQTIPGAFWGRSLPELMRDIQRMCNAVARALSNNLGIASGPQIELYVDRLADNSDVTNIEPFHIWQFKSDTTGAGGRAIQFWQPSSNAQELLAVYDKFEIKADDATGIPRYAYGNERVGQAAATASGLSMLMESAAKGIKDAIRNIDFGLIKPRIEYQFYWNVVSNQDVTFTGDITVVPKASEILTIKAANEMRRNEFLNILANPNYQQIVSVEGMAEILREMSKSLGLSTNIVPSRIELKKRIEEGKATAAQNAQVQQQQQADKTNAGVQATQIQSQTQLQINQQNQELKKAELQLKADNEEKDRQIKVLQLQADKERDANREVARLKTTQMVESNKSNNLDKEIALSVRTGDRVNNQ